MQCKSSFKGVPFSDPCPTYSTVGLESSLKWAQKNFTETKADLWLQEVKDLTFQILALKKMRRKCVKQYGGTAKSLPTLCSLSFSLVGAEVNVGPNFGPFEFDKNPMVIDFDPGFHTRFTLRSFDTFVQGTEINVHYESIPRIGHYDPGTGIVTLSQFTVVFDGGTYHDDAQEYGFMIGTTVLYPTGGPTGFRWEAELWGDTFTSFNTVVTPNLHIQLYTCPFIA